MEKSMKTTEAKTPYRDYRLELPRDSLEPRDWKRLK